MIPASDGPRAAGPPGPRATGKGAWTGYDTGPGAPGYWHSESNGLDFFHLRVPSHFTGRILNLTLHCGRAEMTVKSATDSGMVLSGDALLQWQPLRFSSR